MTRARLGRAVAATAIAGLAVLLLARPAAAQDRPPVQPTRDAAVTYSGLPGAELHMAWLAAARRSRSDLAPGIWSLHDAAAGTTVVVNDTRKEVLAMPGAMPGAGATQLDLPTDARFTRGGTDSIAGTTCTQWRIQAGAATSTACITAEGIPLRVDAGGVVLTATAVSLAPQDPARFEVPAGYRRDGPL